MKNQTIPLTVFRILMENRDRYLNVLQIEKLIKAEMPPDMVYLLKGLAQKIYNSMHIVRKMCDEQGISFIQRGKYKKLVYKIAVVEDADDADALERYLNKQNIRARNSVAQLNDRVSIAEENKFLPEQLELKILDK
jgi:uncharacterized SAM-binding protein YcdF (DUF218 family)